MFATSLAVMATRVARGRRSWRAYPKYGTTAVTRFAEARRQASAIISSSIKCSAGGCVGCRMNTSRPRTFSLSSTLTSPSLNRSTSARPNGTCKCRVISCASGALALPVNTAIDNEPNSLFCCIDLAQNGWGGRIRTSVWRDQNPLPYRLATPQLAKKPTTGLTRSAIPQARASHSVREPESFQTLAAPCALFLAQAPSSHRPEKHRPPCQSGAQNHRPTANRAHVQLHGNGVAPRPSNRSFHQTPGNREL